MIDTTIPDEMLPESWWRRDYHFVNAAWLSKNDARQREIERINAELIASVRLTSYLELGGAPFKHLSDWHMLFQVESDAYVQFRGFETMVREVESFLKSSTLDAGRGEFLYDEAKSPVQLNEPQRIALAETFKKEVDQHDFTAKTMFELLVPYGDYALWLGIERHLLRDEFDSVMSARDNPLKSLEGLSCDVLLWTFEAQEKGGDLDYVGEGILERDRYSVRVGEWQHTFDETDEVINSTAFKEVSIRSNTLRTDVRFYYTKWYPDEEEDDE